MKRLFFPLLFAAVFPLCATDSPIFRLTGDQGFRALSGGKEISPGR